MKWFYKIGYVVLRAYWFVFRPKTFGVRVVLLHGGKCLLIRNSYGSGKWNFPGGRQDRGEGGEETAIREIREELGIGVNGLEFLGQFVSTREYKVDTVKCYKVQVASPDFQIDNSEVIEARWFDKDKLPSDTTNTVDEVLDLL